MIFRYSALLLAACAMRAAPVPPCSAEAVSALSPDRSRTATVIACPASDEVRASLAFVLEDKSGEEIFRLLPLTRKQIGFGCQPDAVEWLNNDRVGFVCIRDPNQKDYLIINTQTRAVERHYTGAWFQWSPDRQVLAHASVELRFAAPPGQNYCLFLNDQPAYPAGCSASRNRDPYRGIHSIFFPIEWSPDSRSVAFTEKIYNWEYVDPFNRYFGGIVHNRQDFLVIASIERGARGYPLGAGAEKQSLQWQSGSQLRLAGHTFDLISDPPLPIP